MFDKKYIVGKKVLRITTDQEKYINKIEKFMMMFDEYEAKKTNYYIKFLKDKVIYKTDRKKRKIYKSFLTTDVYSMLNNILANMINDEKNIIMHSAVIASEGKGVLVLGDFYQGKTHLCMQALKDNLLIASADQTILKIEDEKMIVDKGSRYMRVRNDEKEYFLDKINEKIEIKYILNLIGACDEGELVFNIENNDYSKIRMMFKYCTWHSDIPLFTNEKTLYIDRIKIKKWLTRVKIPLYNVRGDVKKISLKIKEDLR